ncbi:SDR family NAD(P)-dependent oxidoreductase [Actinoplanes sp. CA-030573]|uniref:SDR family NAD(P)-dependent oxidoreductase n=1 Tax=Actinoplanes sp. CA-030573 TaxID=3239898 RepID=UPI003D8C9AB5
MTIEGKTAVVTGGSRGIGRAVVRRLTAAGATVVYTYAHDPGEPIEGARAVRADQRDPANLGAVFDAVGDGLDILVNNAAVVDRTPIEKLTAADIDRVMTINFVSPLVAVQRAIPLLRDGGRIVNISTLNTVLPGPGLTLYCASKGALEQVTAVAARELGPRGITVNTVSPGATDTEMFREANGPDAREAAAGFAALKRIGTPSDIADVVLFLASEAGRWITGQNIRATGGMVV